MALGDSPGPRSFGCAAEVADQAVRSGSHPCVVMAAANRAGALWTHVAAGDDEGALDAVFLLASITKPILATAVLQLVERGTLLLDVPVARYLPEFGAHGKQAVTARHLLTHTSGLEESEWMQGRVQRPAEPGACFADACASHLRFEPGTRCEYCTLTFAVLAELLTRLGGMPYPDYLHAHVFAPMGMRDTAFSPAASIRAARVHDFGDPAHLEGFVSRAVAGGGLWSTAADMVAFGRAMLLDGRAGAVRLLSAPAVELMTRDHTAALTKLVDGRAEPFHYGLGWGKPGPEETNPGSPRAFGHGGATGTLLWVDPDWDLVFVFLTNRWGVEQETPRRALNAVYGALPLEAEP